MVAALIFNVCGAYLVFESVKFGIKKEVKRKIKAGIPDSQLTTLRFLAADVESGTAGIDWVEGHEFRFNGKMYDVVRTSNDNGFIVYHCINDTQEETLFANLGKLIDHCRTTDKSAQQKTQHLLQFIIHEALQESSSHFAIDPQVSIQESSTQGNIAWVFIEVLTPPPDTNLVG